MVEEKEENTIKSYESEDKINHCFGLDFNSLYPSAFSSIKHEFCKYTDNKMYIPGLITNYFESKYKQNLKDNKFIHDLIYGNNKHSTKPIF